MRCSICQEEIRDDAAFCPYCASPVEGAPTYDDFRYEAFVSYRHLPHDEKVAVRVQRALEGMAIPREVRRTRKKTRLGKLFRDQDELPTSSSLGGQIEEALQQSPWLIVVCSPETPQSQWVNREVELFAGYHGRDHILLALAEGESQQSFPPLLLTRFAPDGTGAMCETADEPIAADMREGTRKRFPAELARIAAPLMGCGYDDLRRRQHARRMRIIAGATSLAAVLSSAFGAFSWYQQRQIEANYRAAQTHESESLAVEAERLLAQGDRMEAIQVAMAALPESSAASDRPLVPAAQLALEHALEVYPSTTLWRSCYAIKDVTTAYAFSPTGLHAFEAADGTVQVRTLEEGSVVATMDPRKEISAVTGGDVSSLNLQFCGERLVCYASGGMAVFDATTGTLAWRATIDSFNASSDVTVSPDANHLAIGASFGPAHVIGDERSNVLIVRVIDVRDGSVTQGFKLPLNEYGAHTDEVRFAYSPDGGTLAVANSGRLWTIDLATGDVNWINLSDSGVHQLAWFGDSIVCVCTTDSMLGLYTDTVQVACYTPELYQRWNLPFEAEQAFDAHGLPLDTDTRAVGTYELAPEDEEESQETSEEVFGQEDGEQETQTMLVLATGSTVRHLVLESGEELSRQSTSSPIRASLLDGLLCLADQDGNVSAQVPGEESSISELTQLNVATGSYASFGKTGGITYLAAYDSDSDVYRIYRLTPRSYVPDRNPLKSKYLHTNLGEVCIGTPQQLLVSASDTELAGLDANTLKRVWKRSFAWLGYEDGSCSSSCGDKAIYVFETDHKGDDPSVITVLSPADGKPTDHIELGEDWDGLLDVREVAREESTRLVIRDLSSAAALDVATHEELVRVTPASGQIVDAWLLGDALLVLEAPSFGGTASTLELFSLADGSAISAPLCSYTVKTGGSRQLVSIDQAQSMVAVSCSDGRVRAFGAEDGALLWEGSEDLPGLNALAFSADRSSLLAQDATGTCLLLSAEDGHAIAASSAMIPNISAIWTDPTHPELLTALYQLGGLLNDVGIATISLDPDCFGPLSDTFTGLYYTPDGALVLTYDTMDDSVFATCPHYTLDDLLARARATIEGHELTDAERRLYRIEN